MKCLNCKKDCFALRNNGTCHALSRPSIKDGNCTFYQSKNAMMQKLRKEAEELECTLDEHIDDLKALNILHYKF